MSYGPVPMATYAGAELPAPKFATVRDPSRPTLGQRRGAFARIWLRQPFMPWQQMVADVGGELHDRGDGLWVPYYDLVVCTLQRQAGKSHLSLASTAERCVSIPGWRSWYTAQTGKDARDQFLKFEEAQVRGTPLARLIRPTANGQLAGRSNGHEVMSFRNDSAIRPHPPTEKSLHGKQSDENDIDEAWAFDLEDGRALMQAIGPTQLTRPMAQTRIWSAGGTPQSTWLARLVADGRSGADRTESIDGQPGLRMAYFEWGIPDDLELGDLETIAAYHPAVGHTIDVDGIRKLRTLLTDDGDFARAAGNRWTDIIGGAIPGELWRQRRYDPPIPEDVPVAWGAARAADGSHVVLAAAARIGELIVAEALDELPAFGAAEAIRDQLDGDPVAVAPTGPSSSLRKALLRMRGVRVLDQDGRDESVAVQDLLDGITAGGYRFRRSTSLDSAVKVAGTRTVGDGGRAWARVSSGAAITALDAVTEACWALVNRPAPASKPRSRHAVA